MSIVVLSGCFDSSGGKVLCGKVQYMTVTTDWTRHSIFGMNNQYYSIYDVYSQDYEILKFAYKNNCNVSVFLTYYTDGDYAIKDGGVTLLDCGCNKILT